MDNIQFRDIVGSMHVGLCLIQLVYDPHGKPVDYFTVRLPIGVDARSTSSAVSPGLDAAPSRPLRILVVDDNEDAASSLAMLLEHIGHVVSVSNDGLDAVREAARFMPEFVFLDIGLPGLNGYEVVKASPRSPACARCRSWR